MPNWSNEEKNFLWMEYPNTKTEEIARGLNRTVQSIYGEARRLGLRKTLEYLSQMKSDVSPSRKYTMRRAKEIKSEVSIENLCYIAGLFDGEGCVHLRPKRDKFRLRAKNFRVSIANTNIEVLEWIQTLFKMGHIYKGNYVNKQCYHLTFSCWQAKVFLEAILPYLRIKRNETIEKIQEWVNQ